MANNNKNVQSLIFDVFGTVVDWRTSIKNGLKKLMPKTLNEKELESFAVEWRKGYTEFIQDFNLGKKDWKKIDDVHYSKLIEIFKNNICKGVLGYSCGSFYFMGNGRYF